MLEKIKSLFTKKQEAPIRQQLGKRARGYNMTGMPKRLLVGDQLASEFIANGKKYVMFAPSDVLNIDRADTLRHLQIAFNSGHSVGEIKEAFRSISDNVASLMSLNSQAEKNKQLIEVLDTSQSFLRTMFSKELGTFKHGAALYICTFFVLPEGYDLTKQWSFEEADKIIDDWSKENIAVHDFFLLAEVLCNDSAETAKRYFQSQAEEKQQGAS